MFLWNLFKQGTRVQKGYVPLTCYYDVKDTNIDVVKLFIAKENPSKHEWLLKAAVRHRKVDIIRLLLEDSRIDPSIDDNSLIVDASTAESPEIVDLLLKDPSVDPSVNDNRPVRLATFYGNWKVVDRLLKDKRVVPITMKLFLMRVGVVN